MIGDDAKNFAEALVKLMSDDMLRKTMAINTHQLYQEKYSLQALVKKRETVYQAIL